jgi:hypothetical protein
MIMAATLAVLLVAVVMIVIMGVIVRMIMGVAWIVMSLGMRFRTRLGGMGGNIHGVARASWVQAG